MDRKIGASVAAVTAVGLLHRSLLADTNIAPLSTPLSPTAAVDTNIVPQSTPLSPMAAAPPPPAAAKDASAESASGATFPCERP